MDNEELRRRLFTKLEKRGGDIDGDCITYDSELYYVNLYDRTIVKLEHNTIPETIN